LNDEILDPGETGEILISIANEGSGYSYNSVTMLYTIDANVTLSGGGNISVINPGETGIIEQPFTVSINPDSPIEYFAEVNILVQDENGLTHENTFNLPKAGVICIVVELQTVPQVIGQSVQCEPSLL